MVPSDLCEWIRDGLM
uniref:Uncharacterized protein n=1 Tax=Arundo donax TaxID=35708 RepID=A0A0A8Z9R1_ARUDO